MPEFKLPDVGEGLTEAEIVAWRVAVGDTVKVNDVVVEIETAKSIVELPSPFAGEVTALLVAEGDLVTVGTPIIVIGEPVTGVVDPVAPSPQEVPTVPVAAPVIDTNVPPEGNATLVGYGPKQRELRRRERVGFEARSARTSTTEPARSARTSTTEQARSATIETTQPAAAASPLAKPPVRKLAKDLGIDLADLVGSGPGGVITRADVTGAGDVATTAPAVAPTGGETREPVKGVRKQMAAAMVSSAFSAPHVTEWITIDATATVELTERLRARREFADLKVSPLLVIARALLLAVRRNPLVNSTWDEAAQEVVVKHFVNLGIAAATPRGLVVPNIKDAHALDLLGLATALDELIAVAKSGRTQPADLTGGSITITNVGVFGVDAGTPIINPGESAILCVGAIKSKPWVVDGQVVPRHVMTLALSFDHRHVDGAAGSQFLADIAGIVEDPGTALLF